MYYWIRLIYNILLNSSQVNINLIWTFTFNILQIIINILFLGRYIFSQLKLLLLYILIKLLCRHHLMLVFNHSSFNLIIFVKYLIFFGRGFASCCAAIVSFCFVLASWLTAIVFLIIWSCSWANFFVIYIIILLLFNLFLGGFIVFKFLIFDEYWLRVILKKTFITHDLLIIIY